MATIRGESHNVPICLPIGAIGVATVSEHLLSLMFGYKLSTMWVEKEVYVDQGGILQETILQLSDNNDVGAIWLLTPGKYRVFGLVRSQMFGSSEILTPNSTTSTVQMTLPSRVKVECPHHDVTVLSDSLDDQVVEVKKEKRSLASSVSHSFSQSESQSYPSGPPLHPNTKEAISIIDCLRQIRKRPCSKSEVNTVDLDSVVYKKVNYLPPLFDGDVMFELPAIQASSSSSLGKLMDGMDKKYDGHTWCKTKTSNIVNDFGLIFRIASCVGHLRCLNDDCSVFLRTSNRNETEWEGSTVCALVVGGPPPIHSTLTCRICKIVPACVAICRCKMYYVLNKHGTSRACIHLGHHDHPVSEGVCRETIEKIATIIGQEVAKTPTAKNSAIALAASKEFLSGLLLEDGGKTLERLRGASLNAIMDKYRIMSSPNIWNIISSFRPSAAGGYMDNIIAFKEQSKYDYIQNNIFPGQGANKVFLFKMSEEGPASSVDLARRMQPRGDLQNGWIMFDHVKRVRDWTTLACHVYDPKYCKVMTIPVCDMQSEDAEAQKLMWRSLNKVMERNDVSNPNFKGFMADSAQANWNAVRVVYGSGDPKVPMVDRERTCLLHWTTSLDRHTQKLIKPNLQCQHKKLCKQYKDAQTLDEAQTRYLAIRAWWLTSGAATEDGIRQLDDWLAFWHFRYRQWGGFMQLGLDLEELADMPSCNLAETIHNKWLQMSGNRGSDLYAATVDDYIRAFMQSTNYHVYLKGYKSGNGPDKDELRLRAARCSRDPKKILVAVGKLQGGEALSTRTPHLEGEEVFGSMKRKLDLPPGSDNDSHRPDKVNFSHPRVQTRSTRAQKELSTSPSATETAIAREGIHATNILESNCDPAAWHIARCIKASIKCYAMQYGAKKKCGATLVHSTNGTPAPTYSGQCIGYVNKLPVSREFWFCADDIVRCVQGSKVKWVLHWPNIPTIWPIKIGTNFTRGEILCLEEAGFQLQTVQEMSPRRLFGESSTPLSDTMDNLPPANPDSFPSTRYGKKIRRNNNAPTVEHSNKWETARNVNALVREVTPIPYPGFGRVITLESGIFPKQKKYQVTLSAFPDCTCDDFINMSAASLGKRKQWVNCKHLYYVFRYLCKQNCKDNNFIHAPSFSYNEVQQLLKGSSL